MSTGLVIFILSIIGALGVYLMMPGARHGMKPKLAIRLGALVALATLASTIYALISLLTNFSEEPTMIFFYIFGALAIGFAIRVITHHRPVYSALYFIMVVLSVAGMFLLLEAEFMATAMIIIYGGAILVTYMFVIMLATLPQREGEEFTGASYDRNAHEPLIATFCGFALLAVICSLIVVTTTPHNIGQGKDGKAITQSSLKKNDLNTARGLEALATMPRRLTKARLESVLRRDVRYGLTVSDEVDEARIPQPEEATGLYPENPMIVVFVGENKEEKLIPLTDELAEKVISNTDHVGIALFRGQVLGIELAGVILLMAMVGAIVIARKYIPEEGVVAEDTPDFPRG